MKKLQIYLRDRLLVIIGQLALVLLGAGLFLIERYRHAALIDLSSMYYYIVLACVAIAVGHMINYLRIRPYYESLLEAIHSKEPLEAIYILHGEVSKEQELMQQLLVNQQRMYKTQLDAMERKREIQHHFTLQWVHQMKTPLSVLDMQLQQTADRLKQGKSLSTNEQADLSRSMSEETEKLNNGLDLMLSSARLDKLELDLHIKPVELHTVIREYINRYKKLLIQYSIFPKLTGEAIAATDQKWFGFIMNQLITNAIKYSKLKAGSKSLYIVIDKQSDVTSVTIKDEGIGIAATDIKRIFDPFFTGQNGRMTGESTGMGLYLAKEVCQRLGHMLKVSSSQGEGAEFTLIIKESGIHRL